MRACVFVCLSVCVCVCVCVCVSVSVCVSGWSVIPKCLCESYGMSRAFSKYSLLVSAVVLLVTSKRSVLVGLKVTFYCFAQWLFFCRSALFVCVCHRCL